METTLVVTGASGRVGRLLRAAWELTPPPADLRILWCGRGAGMDLDWVPSPGSAALPEGCTVLHLAGVVRGSAAELSRNADLARDIGLAARASGGRRVLFASTIAVYGARCAACAEGDAPHPETGYGRAKLVAELALTEAAVEVPVTMLRIGNVVGADALLTAGRAGPVTLDPVAGQDGGPVRSWIGPRTLARVLAALALLPDLPPVLNLASPPALPMAALLQAAGLDWHYGPENPAVLPRAELDLSRLAELVSLPKADAASLVAEWRSLKGVLS